MFVQIKFLHVLPLYIYEQYNLVITFLSNFIENESCKGNSELPCAWKTTNNKGCMERKNILYNRFSLTLITLLGKRQLKLYSILCTILYNRKIPTTYPFIKLVLMNE